MEFKASACAKLILAGEHLVVHGYDGLAIPLLDRQTTISLRPNFNTSFNGVALNDSKQSEFQSELKIFCQLLNLSSDQLAGYGFEVNLVETGIGLGASASFAVAMLKVLAKFKGEVLTQNQLLEYAAEIEKLYHGNPSGIDHTTIVLEQPILFHGSNKTFNPLQIQLPEFFRTHTELINTGKPKESTKQMVEFVTQKIQSFSTKQLDEINAELPKLIQSLEENNLPEFKRIINVYGQFLESLPICTDVIKDQSSQIRTQGGAAKICGAGGLTNGSGILFTVK
jgi:mevalonate kinase